MYQLNKKGYYGIVGILVSIFGIVVLIIYFLTWLYDTFTKSFEEYKKKEVSLKNEELETKKLIKKLEEKSCKEKEQKIMESKGLVYFRNKWITPEEKKNIILDMNIKKIRIKYKRLLSLKLKQEQFMKEKNNNNNYYGDIVKCNSCNFTWKIAKKIGKPMKCHNCNSKDLSYTYIIPNNLWYQDDLNLLINEVSEYNFDEKTKDEFIKLVSESFK